MSRISIHTYVVGLKYSLRTGDITLIGFAILSLLSITTFLYFLRDYLLNEMPIETGVIAAVMLFLTGISLKRFHMGCLRCFLENSSLMNTAIHKKENNYPVTLLLQDGSLCSLSNDADVTEALHIPWSESDRAFKEYKKYLGLANSLDPKADPKRRSDALAMASEMWEKSIDYDKEIERISTVAGPDYCYPRQK